MMHEWDGKFTPDSNEATVFTLYFNNAVRVLFSELDESVIEKLMDTDEFLDGFLRLSDAV